MPRTRPKPDISGQLRPNRTKDLSSSPTVRKAAIDGSAAGMFALDGSGTVIMVNAEFCRLSGYTPDQLIGEPIDRFLPQAGHERNVPPRHIDMAQQSAPALGHGADIMVRRKDGVEIETQASFAAAAADGRPIVVCTIIDVSEQRRRERIKDDFFATLSHELRTPITSISAALGLLAADAGKTMSQPALQLIEIAHANCQRLIRMTTDVLDLRKLDAGRMTFRFKRCEAGTLLRDAIAANRALAREADVTLVLGPLAAPVPLYVDPDRFMQVMTNLLSNAIKFSPPDESIQIAAETRGGRVHITIRDRGPGIPADFRQRMFETFAQFEGDSMGQKGGSGLGLSIARSIVTRMHGQIGFDDAPGGGTVFHIDLPDADFVERWQQELDAEQETAGPENRR